MVLPASGQVQTLVKAAFCYGKAQEIVYLGIRDLSENLRGSFAGAIPGSKKKENTQR